MIQSEVLEHATRRRLYDHIVANPGVTFTMLSGLFDLNDGTLNYHLDYLRKGELIEVRKRKNERIYLPNDRSRTNDLAKGQRRMIRAVRQNPGSDLAELSERTGMTKIESRKAIISLKRKRLIRSRKEGSAFVYDPVDDKDLFNEMMRVLMDRYSRGDLTLERFREMKRRLEDMMG